jgi:hypothetical protein
MQYLQTKQQAEKWYKIDLFLKWAEYEEEEEIEMYVDNSRQILNSKS